MKTITPQEFTPLLLSWARNQFAQEVRSGFRRVEQYDGLRAQEHLAVLRMQSPTQLAILSNILPLEVFWETPDAIQKRNLLAKEEREAVEKLRNNYNAERDRNFLRNVEFLKRGEKPEFKELFQQAVKIGNRLHNEMGKRHGWAIAQGGPGEWGLFNQKSWGRVTISVNLGKNIDFTYHLGITNNLRERIRFHDHYLMALGIGAGDWSADNLDQIPEKFLKATEFALWHAGEYEAILNQL
jgi:hypothetical protein